MRPLDCVERFDERLLDEVARHYSAISRAKEDIAEAYRSYIASGCSGLRPIKVEEHVVSSLILAYRSEAKAAGLDWISSIRNEHDLNFCPLCGGPGARTLDHHLPKSAYPEFCIFSKNLVPCCYACNSKRGDSNQPGSEWTLHPYFDTELLGKPLIHVLIGKPWIAPKFEVGICEGLDEAEERRVKVHLRRSIDVPYFRSWIRGQWIDMRVVKAPFFCDGASFRNALRRELAAESARHLNSWNAALLRGVLRDEGLCDWLVLNSVIHPEKSDADLGLGGALATQMVD